MLILYNINIKQMITNNLEQENVSVKTKQEF
jgi:hypothetical protein